MSERTNKKSSSKKHNDDAPAAKSKGPTSLTSTITESPSRAKFATRMRRVSNSRLLFLASLAVVAAVLGWSTHRLLTDSEERLAQKQFESITDRALDMSLDIALRKRQGLVTLTSIAEQAFPDAEMWPFVKMNGFEVVSIHLIETASGDAMSLLPLVTPEQLTEFEEFAKDLYPESGVTKVTGLDQNRQRYNESDGETWWESPHKIFAPFLYSSIGPAPFLTNYHSIEQRGRELDNVITCSAERAQDIGEHDEEEHEVAQHVPIECGFVTRIVDLSFGASPEFEPASVLTQPIYPANNRSVLVGFITSTIKWQETLINVFSSEVRGVDCVLQTETQVYTYEVTDGSISLK
jgi:hypothetical protein